MSKLENLQSDEGKILTIGPKDEIKFGNIETFGKSISPRHYVIKDGKVIPLIEKKESVEDGESGFGTAAFVLRLDKGSNGNGSIFSHPREYIQNKNGSYELKPKDTFRITEIGKTETAKIGHMTFDVVIYGKDQVVGDAAVIVIPYATITHESVTKPITLMKVFNAVEEFWVPADLVDCPEIKGAKYQLKKLHPNGKTFENLFPPREVRAPEPFTKLHALLTAGVLAAGVVAYEYSETPQLSEPTNVSHSSKQPDSTPTASVANTVTITAATTTPSASVKTPQVVSINAPPTSISPMPIAPQQTVAFSKMPYNFQEFHENGYAMKANGRGPVGQIIDLYKGVFKNDRIKMAALDDVAAKLNIGSAAYYIDLFDRDRSAIQDIRTNVSHPEHDLLSKLEKSMGPWETWRRESVRNALKNPDSLPKDAKGNYLWTSRTWDVKEARDLYKKVIDSFIEFGWSENGSPYNIKAGHVLNLLKKEKNGITYNPLVIELANAVGVALPEQLASNEIKEGDFNLRGTSAPESIPTSTIGKKNSLDQILKEIDDGWTTDDELPDPSLKMPGLKTPGLSKPVLKTPVLIPGSGTKGSDANGTNGSPEYDVDVSEFENTKSSVENKAPDFAVSVDAKVIELSKAGFEKRELTLIHTGEVVVQVGVGSVFESIKNYYLGRCDTNQQEADVLRIMDGMKLSQLAAYELNEAGTHVYARLDAENLARLNAAVGLNRVGIGINNIQRARNVSEIRECVSAAANNNVHSDLRMTA